MINAPDSLTAEIEYPAEFHFRIICDTGMDIAEPINQIASQYTVTKDLSPANTSASGRYSSFSISVVFGSRPQMVYFDSAIKALPGVRMLL